MAFKRYNGWQWLLIDAGTNFGLDKEVFEKRMQWTEENLPVLESFIDKADNKPLYIKGVQAIRKAQMKQATGHMIGVDASASGIQMLSVLAGCITGATSTGMVDPDRRADAYTQATNEMNTILGGSFSIPRKDMKQGIMTSFYGSKEIPKQLFGEDTPELNAFYEAAYIVAPGAWMLLQELLAAWNAYALEHTWTLPDGFVAKVKVMAKQETRIEVDELDHATFTYQYYVNEGAKKGISLPANVTHSVDAYVLRCMHRRCNYDVQEVALAHDLIQNEINLRTLIHGAPLGVASDKVAYYQHHYERSGMADAVILAHLDTQQVKYLSMNHLRMLNNICSMMLSHKPFPLITVHDEFKSHVNNIDQVRFHYKEIMAELAESNLMNDLLTQLGSKPVRKPVSNLSSLIRNSNYALC